MYQLYDEYVRMRSSFTVEESAERESVSNAHEGGSTSSSLLELLQVVRSGQEVEPMKSELDVYLDEGLSFLKIINLMPWLGGRKNL